MTSRHQLLEAAHARLEREHGTLFKEASVRVALCYPSPYRVAMSSLGYQAIYREIHRHPSATAERAFLPDDVEAQRKARLPLFTLESQRPASECRAAAFSVAYELELTGMFTVLELMGLSPLREERGPSAPLVIAGGPLTFSNPEPLEPFVDLLVQGEAEGLMAPLLDALASGASNEEIRVHFAKVPGFRAPGLSSDESRFFVAKAPDEMLPARSQVLTADTELSQMFLIEPERGCSRGCHYCVMRRTTNGGMRTVPLERVMGLIPDAAKRVGLVGAAVTDHPQICELLEAIVATGREVGVSSLRADRLSARLVNALKAGGAQVLTVASDGASQRMRNLVDRKHSQEQIINAAVLAKAAGLKRLKVYNIVGLPFETDDDIDELIAFTVELSKILPVALGVAPFSAKRNTPLDGAPFAGVEVIEHRLARLRRGLKGRAELRPTSGRWAYVEHVLAQCGPEAGLAALRAHRDGGSFAAYRRAFDAEGCVPFMARRVPDGRRNPTLWPVYAPAPTDVRMSPP